MGNPLNFTADMVSRALHRSSVHVDTNAAVAFHWQALDVDPIGSQSGFAFMLLTLFFGVVVRSLLRLIPNKRLQVPYTGTRAHHGRVAPPTALKYGSQLRAVALLHSAHVRVWCARWNGTRHARAVVVRH